MHEVDVDVIGLQPLQAFLDGRHDPGAAAVTPVRHFVVAHPKFSDNADFLPSAAESACQGLLRYPHTVGFGSVEAVDAAVDPLPDGALKLALLDPPVGAADFPAPKPDCRDPDVGLAKLPVFHRFPY